MKILGLILLLSISSAFAKFSAEISWDPNKKLYDGQAIWLDIKTTEPIVVISGTFQGRPLYFQKENEKNTHQRVLLNSRLYSRKDGIKWKSKKETISLMINNVPIKKTIVVHKYDYKIINKVIDTGPKIPPSKRRREEYALMMKRLKSNEYFEKWDTPMADPLKDMTITSPYGVFRRYSGDPKTPKPHTATDLRAKIGTPLYAPLSGKVVLQRDFVICGKVLILDHGNSLHSMYCHLDEHSKDFKEGSVIEKGTLIGKTGKSGRVSGPHLHWVLRQSGTTVDPMVVRSLMKTL